MTRVMGWLLIACEGPSTGTGVACLEVTMAVSVGVCDEMKGSMECADAVL